MRSSTVPCILVIWVYKQDKREQTWARVCHSKDGRPSPSYLVHDQRGEVLENSGELIDAADNVDNLVLACRNHFRVVLQLRLLLVRESLERKRIVMRTGRCGLRQAPSLPRLEYRVKVNVVLCCGCAGFAQLGGKAVVFFAVLAPLHP